VNLHPFAPRVIHGRRTGKFRPASELRSARKFERPAQAVVHAMMGQPAWGNWMFQVDTIAQVREMPCRTRRWANFHPL
jgi:hypothetical protein